MSAFIVEQKTINKIVTWLAQEVERNTWLWEKARLNGIVTANGQWQEQLAQAMYDLNFQAVNQRYSEENTAPPIQYHPELYGSYLAVLKSLQCWLYQCAEGDVPGKPLYQFFEEVERYLALKIVYALPEWDKAAWG
jgi:hypothetical protein